MPPLPCMDCGVDTYAEADREWYHVHGPVWEQAGLRSEGQGFLCIGCLEARLGRTLTPEDFDGYKPDRRDSGRLRSRRDSSYG